MLKLNTKATDNHGHSYSVTIESRYGQASLIIDNTPGFWHLNDLKSVGEFLFIDYGQDWKCTNIKELLAEVERCSENPYGSYESQCRDHAIGLIDMDTIGD